MNAAAKQAQSDTITTLPEMTAQEWENCCAKTVRDMEARANFMLGYKAALLAACEELRRVAQWQAVPYIAALKKELS